PCEERGLLKMDFLGLRTLTDIKKALDIIKVTQGKEIDFYDMEYNDEGVFKLIGDGDTHAVFQLESEGMKKFMRDLKPSSLEDIIAGISLYRPGPMDKIGEYVYNKKNPDKIKYDHPLCEPILKVTYGVMVYQEQVMQMVQALGGYTLGRADNVRRMMSKKKTDAMEKEREVFINGIVDHGKVIPGCVKNGVSKEVGNKIYDDMISFASYAFNKSHAAAYAVLAYQTAYLKAYYPVEFITAVLNNRITSIDEIRNYLTYLKERDVTVLPPSINKSFAEFSVEDGKVRIGLAAIKNVGRGVIEGIVQEREANGDFTDFVQFVRRTADLQINKRLLESLIYAGAFDGFGKYRSQYIAVYESVIDRVNKDKAAKLKGQFSFFEMEQVADSDTFEYPDMREYPHAVKLAKEKEVAGVYLTGHPLEEYTGFLRKFKYNAANITAHTGEDGEEEGGLPEDTTVTLGGMLIEAERKFTKAGKELAIGKLEDLYGTVDVMIPGFKYSRMKNAFVKDTMVTVTGKLKKREEGATVWVDSIEPWQNVAPEKPPKMICFYLSFSKSAPEIMDSLQDILKAYPGRDETYCKNSDDNKIYPLGIGVTITEGLISEAKGLVGDGNVKVAERERS
ncbi:MAG: DNA polymerase III subunit alpha, partial [Clostridiales bacterium]|nr:DNA polymerase III subunit alpha [Clostridiales bacterium]